MALATRCPACETIFRISTAQAAAKGGMVRCGQCRNVFNSLDALVRVEDLDIAEDDSTESSELESVTAHVEVDSSASASAPVLQTPEAPAFSEWWLPHEEVAAQELPIPSEAASAPADDRRKRPLSDRRVSIEWPAVKDREPEFLRATASRPVRSRTERWMLAVLSIVAAFALTAQVAYVWRNELAARWPAAKPWLVAACAPLRCVVDYPAHIESITIESTALQSSGPNASLYTLTALLRNRDPVAVRYPWLELTLTDTQDRPILRRALRPEDYLASSRDGGKGQGGLAAESELPVRMMFELSGLRFVGYRLEKFYP